MTRVFTQTQTRTQTYQARTQAQKQLIQPEERFYLYVPFEQKEQAKALDCRWDPIERKWYCTQANLAECTVRFPLAAPYQIQKVYVSVDPAVPIQQTQQDDIDDDREQEEDDLQQKLPEVEPDTPLKTTTKLAVLPTRIARGPVNNTREAKLALLPPGYFLYEEVAEKPNGAQYTLSDGSVVFKDNRGMIYFISWTSPQHPLTPHPLPEHFSGPMPVRIPANKIYQKSFGPVVANGHVYPSGLPLGSVIV